MGRTEFELDLSHREHKEFTLEITTITSIDQDADVKNELGLDKKDKKETAPTEAPFELDLSSHNGAEMPPEFKEKPQNTTVTMPSDEDNMHFRRPKDGDISEEDKKEDMPHTTPDSVVNMEDKNTTAGKWIF